MSAISRLTGFTAFVRLPDTNVPLAPVRSHRTFYRRSWTYTLIFFSLSVTDSKERRPEAPICLCHRSSQNLSELNIPHLRIRHLVVFRNPRGQRPQRTPRGGRSEFSDRRQPRDKSHLEQRTRIIEDAFHADIDSIRTNNLCFTQCIAQVLRKQSGIRTNEDHDAALADYYFELGSRHMSYIFRHTNLLHEDGALSLHELLYHQATARKIREGLQSLIQLDVGEVPISLQGRNNTMRFLMPLAHVVCDSNKSRAMIGYLTTDNFEPGKIPYSDAWFKPADFGDDQAREAQADELDGIDVASIFLRFESGHSNNVSIQHCPFRPDMFPLRYLVHGTNEKNLPSIRRLGLLPGVPVVEETMST